MVVGSIVVLTYISFTQLPQLLSYITSFIKMYSDNFETSCTYLHTRVPYINRDKQSLEIATPPVRITKCLKSIDECSLMQIIIISLIRPTIIRLVN